jgi:hypothetical protein
VRKVIGAILLGGFFGALSSVINAVSSPFETVGRGLTDSGWGWIRSVAELASLILDVGWAWAGLAVAVGWWSGTRLRGAVAGVLALVSATGVYYWLDSAILDEPLHWQWGNMVLWWTASVVFGCVLGAVGASIRTHNVIGVLAGATVPVGAIVQMVVLPPGWGLTTRPEAVWARVIVSVTAAAVIAALVRRFVTGKR